MSGYNDFGGYDDGGGGYGGGGGYDGGGFQKNSPTGTSPPKGKGSREQSFQTMTPLTVKLIMDSPQNPQDDSLTVDGKHVTKVVVYGRIVNATSRHTFNDYVVDDGTGCISVSKVVEEGMEATDTLLPQNVYVCVHGPLIHTDGERKVNALSIRIVTDHNELTCHYLSVVFNHLQNTKGMLNDGSKVHAASHLTNSNFGAGFTQNSGNGGFHQAQQQSMVSDMGSALDPDSRMVHDAFAGDMTSDTGLSVQDVANLLRTKGFTLPKVKMICQNLMTEGFIYSTIDDDHFKSTGSAI